MLANTNRGRLLDLAMSWNGAGALRCRIVVDTVLGTFANEHATVRFQMADQVLALHSALFVLPFKVDVANCHPPRKGSLRRFSRPVSDPAE